MDLNWTRRIVAAVLLFLSAASAALGREYTFSKIADTYGSFSGFAGPVINNAGQVAFTANLDAGGAGLYLYSGGTTTTVADTAGAFKGLASPTINNSGQIAFIGTMDSGVNGIFRSSGGATPAPLYTSATYPTIYNQLLTDSGAVAFTAATSNPNQSNVFLGDGAAPPTMIANDSAMTIFSGDLAANGQGTVAFSGMENVTGTDYVGIFTGNGGALTRIVDDAGPHYFFGNPTMNASGTVLVSATRDGYPQDPQSDLLIIPVGGAPVVAADTDGLFKSFLINSINSHGDFASYAATDSNSAGVFDGPDPLIDKVLVPGDTLFGEQITLARISRQGLNDPGQIVVRALTASGNEFLAIATPVPEPGPAALLLLTGSAVATRLGKRHRRW